jgi:hypothetical protein
MAQGCDSRGFSAGRREMVDLEMVDLRHTPVNFSGLWKRLPVKELQNLADGFVCGVWKRVMGKDLRARVSTETRE